MRRFKLKMNLLGLWQIWQSLRTHNPCQQTVQLLSNIHGTCMCASESNHARVWVMDKAAGMTYMWAGRCGREMHTCVCAHTRHVLRVWVCLSVRICVCNSICDGSSYPWEWHSCGRVCLCVRVYSGMCVWMYCLCMSVCVHDGSTSLHSGRMTERSRRRWKWENVLVLWPEFRCVLAPEIRELRGG